MKKFSLLIVLFSFLFLGLGNYSFAETYEQCLAGEEAKAFPAPENCDYLYPSNSPTPETGTPCAKPTNGIINSLGNCSCPTGTKNVNDVCEPCDKDGVCCGISLNTSIPFIGKCIEDSSTSVGGDETGVTGDQAFPVLMGSLTKILVTVILIVSFILIVVGGIMIATGNPSGGKKMIIKVAVGIALLGASGVILRLINPNFFG